MVPRAPVFGFSHGMLVSLPPLAKTSLTAARAKARSPSCGGSTGGLAGAGRNDAVCSASPFFENRLSSWEEKLQPPSASPAASAQTPAGRRRSACHPHDLAL